MARFGIHTTAYNCLHAYILQFSFALVGKIADDRVTSPRDRCVISVLKYSRYACHYALLNSCSIYRLPYIKIIFNNFYIFEIYLLARNASICRHHAYTQEWDATYRLESYYSQNEFPVNFPDSRKKTYHGFLRIIITKSSQCRK